MNINFGKLFKEKDIGSQRDLGMDAEIILCITDKKNDSAWLFTEADELVDGDWLLYGYNHIHKWEWGYVKYSQLPESVKQNIKWKGKKVSDYVE